MATIPHKLQLEMVTPERRVVAREVDEVVLPGVDGSFGVLPGHAAMLAALGPGLAFLRNDGKREPYAVGGGFAEVLPDRVIVLADTAEHASEIDPEVAKQHIRELEKELLQAATDVDLRMVRARIMKHMARIAAAEWKG